MNEEEIKLLEETIATRDNKITKLAASLNGIRDKIESLKTESKKDRKRIKALQEGKTESTRYEITDHAVIRYLERHMEIDISYIRSQIDEETKLEKAIGNKLYFGKGYFIIEGNTLITYCLTANDKK